MLRRGTVERDKPTRDDDRVVPRLTNLPEQVSAADCAELYRQRWSIETLFYEGTQRLECEVKTLRNPPAALVVFCRARVAASAVAVLKAALRATPGEETADEMSTYYLALEIKQVYAGMMIALPPDQWGRFRTVTVAKFAAELKKIAAHMDLGDDRKCKRGPKKPLPTMDRYRHGGHASTHKLLKDKKR